MLHKLLVQRSSTNQAIGDNLLDTHVKICSSTTHSCSLVHGLPTRHGSPHKPLIQANLDGHSELLEHPPAKPRHQTLIISSETIASYIAAY